MTGSTELYRSVDAVVSMRPDGKVLFTRPSSGKVHQSAAVIEGIVDPPVAPPAIDQAAERDRKMKLRGMQDVTWRSTSAFRPEATHIEFALGTACGAVLRFRIAKDEAERLADTLNKALDGEPHVSALLSAHVGCDGKSFLVAAMDIGVAAPGEDPISIYVDPAHDVADRVALAEAALDLFERRVVDGQPAGSALLSGSVDNGLVDEALKSLPVGVDVSGTAPGDEYVNVDFDPMHDPALCGPLAEASLGLLEPPVEAARHEVGVGHEVQNLHVLVSTVPGDADDPDRLLHESPPSVGDGR